MYTKSPDCHPFPLVRHDNRGGGDQSGWGTLLTAMPAAAEDLSGRKKIRAEKVLCLRANQDYAFPSSLAHFARWHTLII